jgi:hypothetical protein
MSAPKFLLDEHVAKRLATALGRVDPNIVVFRMGHMGGPSLGTLDPELVRWAEFQECSTVTLDESTLIADAKAHVRAGAHTWGIFILRSGVSLGKIVNTLAVIAGASQAEEWQDQIVYVPFL